LQAFALQPGAHLLRQLIQLAVGQELVHAHEGVAVGVLAERFFQQVRDRAVLGVINLRRNAFGVRLQPNLFHLYAAFFFAGRFVAQHGAGFSRHWFWVVPRGTRCISAFYSR
jgi:hypothetical protein